MQNETEEDQTMARRVTEIAEQDLSRLLATPEDVAELVELLHSPDRTNPIVIVSVARGNAPYPLAPHDLAGELRGVADVYVLANSDIAWELDRHDEIRTYGGAIRVIGLDGFGVVVRTDGDLDHAFDRIVSSAESAARRTPRRRLTAAADTASGDGQHVTVNLEKERAKRTGAEEKAAAANRQLVAARAEIERLRAELAVETAPLFADPEEQFRYDTARCWLRQVAEAERGMWPLREFRVGPAFLPSLDIPQAPRAKILEVVVDVLTRRAFGMSARGVRAYGNGGPAGVNGQVVRDDGAAAYRCNIRANTPQAPRLMWWELRDGTVELALAGRHDDPMPR